MRRSTNYSLLLPDETDFYSVGDMNSNTEVIDTQMKSNQNAVNSVTTNYNSHSTNKNNPHAVTKSQVGLSNVPNVTTNNQTPTYSVTSTLTALTSGEVLSTAFGKLAKCVSELISHIANLSNPHGVTKSQIGLGNVPNVTTNDQTPTYSDTTTLATLASGEKISVSFPKIKLAITTLINHIVNKNNPHAVTASQVGLGNCNNTSDVNKPISTATQTALNAKQATITGAATSISSSNLTASRALVSDVNGKVSVSEVTSTELGYIDGVTSNVQTQFNNVGSKFSGFESKGQLGSPQNITTSTDLNNMITEGVYSFGQDNTPAHAPADVVNGWLIVLPWSKTTNVTVKQIWLRHGTLNSTDCKIYVRTRITSEWSNWSEVVTDKSNIAHCFTLCDNLIPEKANLNNYKSIGTYRATGSGISATMTNCPTQVNFRMDIEYTSSNNYICQKILDRNAAVYVRVCDLTTSTWTAWKTL